MSRLADRLLRSEPARGPLQLHHLDRKAQICRVRCQQFMQTSVLATVDEDWTKLVDRGFYRVWKREIGPAAGASS